VYRVLILTLFVATIASCSKQHMAPASGVTAGPARTDWPTYGQDKGGQRFSTLGQINAGNVSDLQVAWQYHMRPEKFSDTSGDDNSRAQALAEGLGLNLSAPNPLLASQVTPLVVDGVMYFGTPYNKVVALDPVSGEEVWVYDMPEGATPSRRGLEHWPGDDETGATVFVSTQTGLLIALSAANGEPQVTFGDHGILDLKTDDVLDPAVMPRYGTGYSLTSPPIAYKNLIITAVANGEFPPRGARGDIRAWDARTGALVWRFKPVPESDTLGADTWEEGSMEWRRGVTVWGFMTADVDRGIIYLPFGAPAWDRYGGDRKGDNLFSTSLVAVNADTGEYLWHFQATHHDIWDYDLAAPPTIFDIQKDGRTIPSLGVATKAGFFFILDRTTGEPVYGVEERPVPASNVPGEVTSPTQPFPLKPEPLSRIRFSLDDIATVTPELTEYCLNWIDEHDMEFGGPYLPIGYNQVTIIFPGFLGGSNWQGVSFNPDTGYAYANVSNMGQVYSLVDSTDGPLPIKGGPLSSRFYQEETRLMCQQPPWGELVAVNVYTGEIAWRSVLGTSDNLPEDKRLTGRPNIGGSITTAGGLVFVGATDDAWFRAFDASNGDLLWQTKLEASAHSTPMTYLGNDGRQYVVVSATGGSFLRSPLTGDTVTAWALSANPAPAGSLAGPEAPNP